jgi:cell wall-associated NlpC family hydrolase
LHFPIRTALSCCLIVIGAGSSSALAANTGGAAPASTPVGAPPTPATPKVHLFPVTSRSSSLKYKGPVYVRTATGEVVPFVATTDAAPTAATGNAASLTGGAAPAATTVTASPFPPAGTSTATGPVVRPELLVPGATARYVDGLAAAPMEAPAVVQQIIWGGNELIGLPYIYGGGHASFTSRGYDCSGTVSFALHAAGLLSTPEDSSELENFGSHGAGRWVAVFGNAGHAYMTVAGLRLDTSSADDPSNEQGPRWRPLRPGNPGYVVRHPLGL